MNDHASRMLSRMLYRGLASVAWVFRGADGGQWSEVRTVCLPAMADVLLELESRGMADNALLDLAERVHVLAAEQATVMSSERLEQEYVRLFVNHRSGLSVPLCQSCYTGDGRMMGEPALAMQTRLDQAALRPNGDVPMPPDHLAIELAYLLALFPGQAPSGSIAQPASTADSPAAFAAQVLLPWVGAVRARLIKAEASPLFHLAGELLVNLVSNIAEEKMEATPQLKYRNCSS